jgi:hypothetical protein
MVVKERVPSCLEITMKAGQALSPAGDEATGLFPSCPLRGVFKSYS